LAMSTSSPIQKPKAQSKFFTLILEKLHDLRRRYLDHPHLFFKQLLYYSTLVLASNILSSTILKFLISEVGRVDDEFDLLALLLKWLRFSQSLKFHMILIKGIRMTFPLWLSVYFLSTKQSTQRNKIAAAVAGLYAVVLLLRGYHMRRLLL